MILSDLYNRLKGQCSLWCPLSDKDFHFKRSKDNVLFLVMEQLGVKKRMP
jgi:hypothetical protein